MGGISARSGESSITLSRGLGPAGTSITVSGRGFDAGETVEVAFHVTQMGTAMTNASGAFRGLVIKVPVGSLKAFPYLVTATGKKSAKSAQAPFRVT